MTDWQSIETAPKDGTRFKATHSNARALDQTIENAANCYWDGGKFQMSCFPLSKCGRYIITGQPDLWLRIPADKPALAPPPADAAAYAGSRFDPDAPICGDGGE